MSASKRPSTSSLRRFITSRPYVPVAELRRRFGLDEPDDMAYLHRNGTAAWIGLPEREATKIQDLWERDELGVELSVEVRAPVIVGVYPMRIARYAMDSGAGPNGHGNGHAGAVAGNGHEDAHDAPRDANGGAQQRRRPWPRSSVTDRPRDDHAPKAMRGAPSYGSVPPEPPPD